MTGPCSGLPQLTHESLWGFCENKMWRLVGMILCASQWVSDQRVLCGWEVNVNSHDLWLGVAGGLNWGAIMSGYVTCGKKCVSFSVPRFPSHFTHTQPLDNNYTQYIFLCRALPTTLSLVNYLIRLIRSNNTQNIPFPSLDHNLVG